MPEAPIHEDGHAFRRDYQIRSARQSVLEAVAHSESPELLPEPHLRVGIAPVDLRHAIAALGWRQDVRHGTNVPCLCQSVIPSVVVSHFGHVHPGQKQGIIRSLEHPRPQGLNVRTLDLFCGAGLGSSGARSGGAEVVGAIDLDEIAAATFEANFPDAIVLSSRLENVNTKKLRKRLGAIDLLLASPECTNHTCAKGSAPRKEASRATAMQVLRFATAFKPRWIVMENVIHMRPWSRYTELIKKIGSLGYCVSEQTLDAADFGVPQKRRRLFVICDREGQPPKITPRRGIRARCVRDILDAEGQWEMTPLFRKQRAADTKARARRAITELGNSQPFLIVYYGTDGCGGWQPLDRPLRTITTVDRFALALPTENGYRMRMLQVPELRRAMGLDERYDLPQGTRRDKIRLLGNGVCPPVMKAIVASLAV